MKRIVIGALLASLVVSQAVGPVEAKSKSKKKPVVQVDRDKNGIPDAWQKQYHLGYGKQVATKDRDQDGTRDDEEDTDQDGVRNNQELKRIMIKATDTNKKKFEWRYSNEHQNGTRPSQVL